MRSIASIFTLALLIGLASCTSEEEVSKLKAEKQDLQDEIEQHRVSVNELVLNLEEIQDDMRSITIREGLLAGMTIDEEELAASPKEQILNDISLIDGLIHKNQERIDKLHKLVKTSDGKLYEFERIVANLKLDLLDKEQEMQQVKDNLVAMEEGYASLLEDLNEQTLINTMQDEALHMAYFAFGTKDELITGEVMEKKGGVLGLGSSMSLRADFNRDYFTAVDIRELDVIPLESKKVDFLSSHPEGSYQLVAEDEQIKELRITDADSFWSGSRYLAMVVK